MQGASDGDRGEASQAGREWVLRRERGVLAANGMGEGVEEEEVSHRTAVMQMHVARPPNSAGLAECAFPFASDCHLAALWRLQVVCSHEHFRTSLGHCQVKFACNAGGHITGRDT